MRYFIFILLLLESILTYSQVNAKQNTHQNLDSIIKYLEAKVECEQFNTKRLDSLNTYLKNELIIYKAKEDYFAVALEDQSNRFALIVSSLTFILGLFSFSWFKVEQYRTNQKFKGFNIEFEKIKEENKIINNQLYNTTANSYALISLVAKKEKIFIKSFEFSISAAKENVKSAELESPKNYKFVLSNLGNALEDLKEIIKSDKEKANLKNTAESILEKIDFIQKTEDSDIKDLCAEIRVILKDNLK